MHRFMFLGLFIIIIIAFFGLLNVLALRFLNRDWWRTRWVRRAVWLTPLAGVLLLLLWGLSEYVDFHGIAAFFAAATSLVFILQLSFLLAQAVAGFIQFIGFLIGLLMRPRTERRGEIDSVQLPRRVFLQRAAIVAPVVTMSLGVGGMVRSFSGVRVYKRVMRFKNLPADLDGLRILHMSDLHLRYYVTLSDIEPVIEKAAEYQPDLVLLIGDVADDLNQLPDALRLAEQLHPRFGVFASLGNHEYFRGVESVRRIYDRSSVPLMVNQSHRVTVGKSDLLVAAIDDPRHMGAKMTEFYRRTIDETLEKSPSHTFSVLMSHRPDAFDHASARGINLTLAGHTHGGQIGVFGRSAFEPYWPDRYLWGEYRRNGSQLYTSSGVGHWFPFRLGCPPEAPVIELRRA